ncbi:MAG TPA: hypothetical protein VIU45_02455, partial [Chitinophagaceae bacterium]
FISLEQEGNEIEMVIHVNMLKEGWDVSNLYTIVPLRAANASVLVEQTIGRGLRLPFSGERTGNEKVDKLTVVAHDNFNRVIEAAQDPNSILNKLKYVEIAPGQLSERTEVVTVQNAMMQRIRQAQEAISKITDPVMRQQKQCQVDAQQLLVTVIPRFNTSSQVRNMDGFQKAEVKQQVLAEIGKELNTGQGNLFAKSILAEAEKIYETVVIDYKNRFIEIPRLVLMQEEVTAGFDDFDLHTDGFTYSQLNDEIIRMGLKDKSYDIIEVKSGVNFGEPIDLLVSELMNFSEIDYDANASLLHKLAEQAVTAIEQHRLDGENIQTLIFQWRKPMADRIYAQMMEHFHLHEPGYIKPEVLPFTKIEDWNFTTLVNAGSKDYRDESFPASQTSRFLFSGFKKSCHFEYKFDSRTEQTLAFILENDMEVLRWLRPAPRQFQLYWDHNSRQYEPDFVAETPDAIYMIETKAANEINDPEVQEKAKAALEYCRHATEFTTQNGGKPWKYGLIPHDKVVKNGSFKGVVSPFILQ